MSNPPLPSLIAKSGTEHGHQAALFAWVAVARRYGFNVANDWATGMGIDAALSSRTTDHSPVPELEWFHAIPNGGSRGDTDKSRKIEGGKMKAEGVRSGVADTFLPVRRGVWSGLYIEMKKPGGETSGKQDEFGEFVKTQGFGFVVCEGWEAARDTLIAYLTWKG